LGGIENLGFTFYVGTKEVWQSTSKVGVCFVEQMKSLEQLIDTVCGISSVVSDEIYIDPSQFADFLRNLVVRVDETNNGELAALCIGCLQICFSIQNNIDGLTLRIPPRIIPVLEGSKALSYVNWRIIALQADAEEIALRRGAPRSNRDWVVYQRTSTSGEEQTSKNRDADQRYFGIDLLRQKRYPEAADFFRNYSEHSDSKEWIYLLGMALLEGGNSAEARVAFEKATYCEPGKEISKREQIYVDASQKMMDKIDHSTNAS